MSVEASFTLSYQLSLNCFINSKDEISNYSNSVINKTWGLPFKAFRIASSPSNKLIPFNIMNDENFKKTLSNKKTKNVKALTNEEFEKLNFILDNQEKNHKYRNIVKMQCISGMRIGEVLGRSKSDYNKG